MIFHTDQEFLDEYFDLIAFIWWEFENKKISMKEREELLAPYRTRLHKMITKGIIDERFRMVQRS